MNAARGRWSAALTVVLLTGAMLAVPHVATAAEQLDQEQASPYGMGAMVGDFVFDIGYPVQQIERAQTFTAGITGGLTKVALVATRDIATTGALTVEIRPVTGTGEPSATVLASTSLPDSAITVESGVASSTFVPFVFPSAAPVVAGTTYAIVVRTTPGRTFALNGNSVDSYASGDLWGSVDGGSWDPRTMDVAFQTFVDPSITFGPEVSYDPACSSTGTRPGYITVLGTPGADIITGTNGPDLIYGFGGDDVIAGRGGDDLICSGDGNVYVRGGAGRDTVFGGQGNDRLVGGPRADHLSGGAGDDVLIGRAGRDVLRGGDGNDRLRGGRSNDWLAGAAGNDFLRGGAGRDTVGGGPGHNDVRD